MEGGEVLLEAAVRAGVDHELPSGWCLATLQDVADGPQYGWTASAAPSGQVKLLRTTDISSGRVNWKTVPYCSDAPINVGKYLLRDGDIVISRAGSVGKSFLISNPDNAVFASYLIRFQPLVDGRYVHYYLQTRGYWIQIEERSAGIAIPNVNGSKLKSVVLPIAPLAEQHRIVARIDALFAEIAEGEAALAEARKGLDIFRRALLKAAVTGELTKDWRAANPVSETGYDLLTRIVEKHATKAGAQASSRNALNSALPPIPETWAWATLERLAETVRNGTSLAPRAVSNRHEILRISSVRPLRIDESQIRFLDDQQAIAAADATVKAGDLLFTRYNGTADLVGAGAVYKGPKRFYPDKIIRVRLEAPLALMTEFVELAVNTGAGRKHIAANIKTTAGQQGLSGESLKATPIPVPPPAEAAEIVRRVTDALAAADDALTTLDAEAADAARLKQSILKAAFEGRLVPQDATDQPASALLARLAADRSDVPAKRRRVKSARSKDLESQ